MAQYVRQSGISNRGWRGVGEEVATAGNFGRSFGMDQAASVGAFGTMRQFGVTGGDQDARKMALLIGEGIARSGAFAKSEEFLQAIAGYTSRLRTGHERAEHRRVCRDALRHGGQQDPRHGRAGLGRDDRQGRRSHPCRWCG